MAFGGFCSIKSGYGEGEGIMSDRIDLLNRSKFVENVIKVVNQLSENKKGCCFAIEGGWGIGKTFVIEEIEQQLRNIQSEESHPDRYFVFHYNCWQHDYYEEPAVAIISAMLSSIEKDDEVVSEKVDGIIKVGWGMAKDKLKEIAGLYIENKIGVNLISLFEEADKLRKEDNQDTFKFDELFNFSQTIEQVREKLQEIAKDRTLVLVVDELDRCIPQYAIKVLERLHHIFYGLDNVIVIMAIDRTQLEHSVEEMFGINDNSIDIEKYLKKFIDFSMVLDNGVVNESFEEKYKFYFGKFEKESNDEEMLNKVVPSLFQGIDIRRQEKIIEKANIVHSLICNEKVDVSVLVFEIMYEVLQEWQFGNMEYVVKIADSHNVDLEKKIGKEKIEILKQLESNAQNGNCYVNNMRKKSILPNLYGKVFWYFANIFNENSYYGGSLSDEVIEESKIVKKYCEYCEIIK